MSKAQLLTAGALASRRPYAERSEEEPGWHDRTAEFILRNAINPLQRRLHDPSRRLARIAEIAERHDRALRASSDVKLRDLANDLRMQLRQHGFGPDRVGEAFALVREELVKARAELASLRALSTSYTKVGAAYQSSAIERDQKQLEQQELLRNVKTAEQNYLLYLNKKEEARISDAFDQKRIVNVSIAQAASVPAFPSNPASMVLSIAAVLGCLMGLGAAFVHEQIDSSMGSPDQVEAYLNMPVLAAMPDEIPLRRLPNV